jgi:hypothetical protein
MEQINFNFNLILFFQPRKKKTSQKVLKSTPCSSAPYVLEYVVVVSCAMMCAWVDRKKSEATIRKRKKSQNENKEKIPDKLNK